MQQIILDGESGLNVRNALNENFLELYNAIIVPFKLTGISGAATQLIPANTFVTTISITPIGGTPTLNIGTTNNGGEIFPTDTISYFTPIVVQQYFLNAGLLYFNTTGVGSFNIRIDYIPNYN